MPWTFEPFLESSDGQAFILSMTCRVIEIKENVEDWERATQGKKNWSKPLTSNPDAELWHIMGGLRLFVINIILAVYKIKSPWTNLIKTAVTLAVFILKNTEWAHPGPFEEKDLMITQYSVEECILYAEELTNMLIEGKMKKIWPPFHTHTYCLKHTKDQNV
tara:strand:+ start:1471 stop:1956 length:486 start_codon:yes stop_codon:yes gene_type:complete